MTICPPPDDPRRLATEMFLRAAGPALIKRVAEVLGRYGIPVMPLKGVLLQKLVYGTGAFRPIVDVDVLVPEGRFVEAVGALQKSGFPKVRWEDGGWEVSLRDPSGPPLGVDLHRRLSRTVRSRLTVAGLFARGIPDSALFGAPVMLPSANDLFAHLLLHAALHWTSTGALHRPEDFAAVSSSGLLSDARSCAQHIRAEGLTIHALALLPLIVAGGSCRVLDDLLAQLQRQATAKQSLGARLVRAICSRGTRHPRSRRVAGLLMSPSLPAALASATRDRLRRDPG